MLIYEILEESSVKFADYTAVKWLKKKEILERSYPDFMQNIKQIRRNLHSNGFSKKHIALLGTNSVEWIESFLGIITGDNAAVPLDTGLPIEDLLDLINRSDAEGIFVSPKLLKYVDAINGNCPKIKKIWILSEEEIDYSEAVANVPAEKIGLLSELLVDLPESSEPEAPTGDDTALIIFTSGTTGKSKGVVLTQNNLATNVESVQYSADPGHNVLSVLPVHHAFCLVMDWLKGLSLGAALCINDSLLHMIRNISIFQPHTMLMVPLMIETIYKRLAAAGPDIPKAVLKEKVLGKNLDKIFTGGAHLDPFYVEKFAELGVLVLEGYGMSECSPVISTNTVEDHKIGSIGKPLPNAEIRFENGEILVKSSSVMKEYYKMPEETSEALKDGWLHTGDKGYMDEDGFLFINGRIKNLIILSNGENVSPEEIEGKLALNPLISEVVITGENNGLTARIYPDLEYAKAAGIIDAPSADSTENSEDSEDNNVIKVALQKIIDEYNIKQPSYYRITDLVVRKNPFIKNSTRKIKRQEVLIDEPVG